MNNFEINDDGVISIYDSHTDTVLDDDVLPFFCEHGVKQGTLSLKIKIENAGDIKDDDNESPIPPQTDPELVQIDDVLISKKIILEYNILQSEEVG